MVKCNWCNQEMTDNKTDSCSGNFGVDFGNIVIQPIPYNPDYGDENQRCHDCNVARGGIHHPGCDMEKCPKCGGQLFICGCLNKRDHNSHNKKECSTCKWYAWCDNGIGYCDSQESDHYAHIVRDFHPACFDYDEKK